MSKFPSFLPALELMGTKHGFGREPCANFSYNFSGVAQDMLPDNRHMKQGWQQGEPCYVQVTAL